MTISQPEPETPTTTTTMDVTSHVNGEMSVTEDVHSNSSTAAPAAINTDDEKNDQPHRSVLEKIGGFDLLSRRPLIGPRKNLFVISGPTVRNYSYESGAFLGEFTFGKSRPLIAIQQTDPTTAPDNLTVVSDAGRILVWDTAANAKVDECFLRLGANSRLTTFTQLGDHYYFTVLRRIYPAKKKVSQIFARHRASDAVFALNSGDEVNPNGTDKAVAFGPGGRHCAALHRDKLYVYSIPPAVETAASGRIVHSMASRAKKFTVVAYHPTDESVVATGNNIGQIVIWSNVLSSTAVARRTLHWHSQAVADLAFSPAGSSLYSVGAEKTLVKWNTVGKFAGERSFLPRLGAALLSVVVSGPGGEESSRSSNFGADNIIVTSMADQTLAVIDGANMSNGILRQIEGLSVGFSEATGKFSAPTVAYCARLQALVLNGRTGHLQLYQPASQRQLRQLDITEQNVVSAINVQRLKERLKGHEPGGQEQLSKVFPLEVIALAVSAPTKDDGCCWLATVEFRDDGETMPEVRLKFWESDPLKGGHYRLNTTVHLPHTDRVNSIAFSRPIQAEAEDGQQSNQLHLVTTGADRSFKIWDLNVTSAGNLNSADNIKSNVDGKRRWWSCSRTASLNAAAEPKMAAFSADGSLVAVLFDEATLTLWELGQAPDVLRYIPRLDLFEQSSKQSQLLQQTEESASENGQPTSLPSTLHQPYHHQQQQEPIIFLDFAGDATPHFLITATATAVTVRNVLKKFAVVFRLQNPELAQLEQPPKVGGSSSSKGQLKAARAAQAVHRWTLMALSKEDGVLAAVSTLGVSFISVVSGQLLMRHTFEHSRGFKGAILTAFFTPEVPPSSSSEDNQNSNSLPVRQSTFYCINEKHELFQLVAFDGARVFREENASGGGLHLSRISERERRELYMQAVLRTKSPIPKQDSEEGLEGRAGSEVNRAKERKALVDKFFYSVPSHVLPPVALYEKAYLTSLCTGLLKLTRKEQED